MYWEIYTFGGLAVAVGAAILVLNKKKKRAPSIVVPPVKPPVEIEQPRLNWADRRPIGMVMLSNYKEWNGTDNYMTDDFWEFARQCIANMKGYQGCIAWDAEGTKFPRAYSYYGDPTLAPAKVDVFFSTIKAAGFRTGICIRPDEIKMTYEGAPWNMEVPHHFVVVDWFENLDKKVTYAQSRWGCTLFYVDSNVGVGQEVGSQNTQGYGRPIPAEIFARLHKKYPNCLFIPEHHDATYEPYTALYWAKGSGKPDRGMAVVDCADTNAAWLADAVDDGHILMGRTWHEAPELDKIKQAYDRR